MIHVEPETFSVLNNPDLVFGKIWTSWDAHDFPCNYWTDYILILDWWASQLVTLFRCKSIKKGLKRAPGDQFSFMDGPFWATLESFTREGDDISCRALLVTDRERAERFEIAGRFSLQEIAREVCLACEIAARGCERVGSQKLADDLKLSATQLAQSAKIEKI